MMSPLHRRVLDGRTPEEFERAYGPAAADKLFGPRHGVKPSRPIPMMLRIATCERARAGAVFALYELAPDRAERLAAHAVKASRLAGVPVENTAHRMAATYVALVAPHIEVKP